MKKIDKKEVKFEHKHIGCIHAKTWYCRSCQCVFCYKCGKEWSDNTGKAIDPAKEFYFGVGNCTKKDDFMKEVNETFNEGIGEA